jgi:prophage antirepressor-like protein
MTASIQHFTFEGQNLTTIEYKGQPVWIAREVGRLLGYANDGKRLLTSMAGWEAEMIPGVDTILLKGDALRIFKEMMEGVTNSVTPFRQAKSLTLLTKAGVFLVCLKTNQQAGIRLRRWLVDEVLPQIRRTGRYEGFPGDRGVDAPDAEDRLRAVSIMDCAKRLHRSHQIDSAGYGEMLRQAAELLGATVTLHNPGRARDPEAALRSVRSWAEANRERFEGGSRKPPSPLGRWTPRSGWSEIAFLPSVLCEYLRTEGFDADAILRDWALNGWLRCEPGRRTSRRRIQARTMPCVVLSRYGLDQAGDDAGQEGGEE